MPKSIDSKSLSIRDVARVIIGKRVLQVQASSSGWGAQSMPGNIYCRTMVICRSTTYQLLRAICCFSGLTNLCKEQISHEYQIIQQELALGITMVQVIQTNAINFAKLYGNGAFNGPF